MHINKHFIKEIENVAKNNVYAARHEDQGHLYCSDFNEEFARLILTRCLDQLDNKKFYSQYWMDDNTPINKAKCDLIQIFGIDPSRIVQNKYQFRK